MGTLISSVQRQDSHSVIAPPASTPTAPAAPDTPLHQPKAFARASGRVNVVPSTVSVAGAMTAAPSPWKARARISVAGLCAAPPTALASVNRPTPARKTRRCPNRSASLPPSSKKPQTTTVYALLTSCR